MTVLSPGDEIRVGAALRLTRADGGRFVSADENASLSVTILRAIFDG